MLIKPLTLLVGFGLVITVADAVPRYDVTPTCRAAVNLVAGGGRGELLKVAWPAKNGRAKNLRKIGQRFRARNEANASRQWLRAGRQVTLSW